ncbi:MAG: hypothetical protein A2033_00900 [Bacteroidetes bacterium GWA2_31_9]|nr:MAG: hypothetical protein A2033_00900 [Bacteroidetes bacterium GWA2_31_9]
MLKAKTINKSNLIALLLLCISVSLYSCKKDDSYFENSKKYGNHRDTVSHDTIPIVEIDTLALTQLEIDTILNGDTSQIMRVLKVTDYNDSLLLRQVCKDVRPDTTDTILSHLIRRMYYTVKDPASPGVGISAIQIGIYRNIIWVQRKDKPLSPFEVYLNPVIKLTSSAVVGSMEGCLSIPNTTKVIDRYRAIEVDYYLPDGSFHSEVIEGYTAKIFQHEIDHLNGILFTDHVD